MYWRKMRLEKTGIPSDMNASNVRESRNPQEVSEVPGTPGDADARRCPVEIFEASREIQHLRDRVSPPLGDLTIPQAHEWNQGNRVSPKQALPLEWPHEGGGQNNKSWREHQDRKSTR